VSTSTRVSHRPFDDCMIGESAARLLTRLALWGGPLAVAVLALGAFTVGVPAPGEARYWQTTAQILLLAVYGVSSLLARRWPMPSATVMTVTAFAIGALANVEVHPRTGLLIAVSLWLPAGIHWLVWQRTKPVVDVLGLAMVLAVSVGAAGYVGNWIWDFYQGPQTEQSQREPYPATGVRWVWTGAVTTSSFTVVARMDEDVVDARLRYGPDPALATGSTRTPAVRVDPDTGAARFEVGGLESGTTYYYALETGDLVDMSRQGQVQTFSERPETVTVAFASCARTGSNAQVFESIREVGADLFLLTGDLHYEDLAEDRELDYVRAYDVQLSEPAPQALYLSTPSVYMWDDHDYGPNDGDRTSRSRPAALQSYREMVPHYPFAMDSAEAPIAQAFSIGRVRFLVTDLRSARDPKDDPDGAEKTMMGSEQLAWFERELVSAARSHALVVWVSSVPWLVSDNVGDSWGAYPTERDKIADLVVREDIDNLVMLAGDAHMVAADDGSNNTYGSLGEAGFPVLQAAALDRQGSLKGGPYSEGAHPGAGQYGLLQVTDNGADGVSLRFEGRTWDGEVLVDLDATFDADLGTRGDTNGDTDGDTNGDTDGDRNGDRNGDSGADTGAELDLAAAERTR
jgi:phosphodiesterase/alkaline phosphatase D-like protein